MSEKPVCHRCGYVGPEEARFCARCGRTLVPASVRLIESVNRILNSLSPVHIGFLGLVLSISISVYANHLIVGKLTFPLSLILLALVIGGGFAYLGWYRHAPPSNRRQIKRMLVVFVGMGVFIAAIGLMDRGLLGLLSDRSQSVVYNIPGVYIEASQGVRRISIASDLPPYWLLAMLYGIIAAAAGNLAHKSLSARRQEQL